ncbi:MAG: protoheme IX farnesyltransferase [Candidatus Eremiobacteraeota bacterium]|nr:protoheme IX farnesyltransferase [Candidatus Eremiobacteraeota bacterium]
MNTLSRIDAPLAAPQQRTGGWRGVLLDYYELGKPRIVLLLLITTAAAMAMAAHGMPPPELMLWTLLGGALSAASAGAYNCVIDRDIDRVMRRTMQRPVATGRISVRSALVAATLAGIAGVAILFFLVNPLAAALSFAGNVYYVFVYTVWLKRRTPQNIVIGGAAGAIPPLVGWAAVTHEIGAPALGLFAIIFLWTPPHFWALSLITNADYDRAGIPMFANVYGIARTKREILLYTLVLVGVSLTLVDIHVMGAVYGVAATILGAIFVYDAIKLTQDDTRRWARTLFKFSLLYLALICAAMVIDRILL